MAALSVERRELKGRNTLLSKRLQASKRMLKQREEDILKLEPLQLRSEIEQHKLDSPTGRAPDGSGKEVAVDNSTDVGRNLPLAGNQGSCGVLESVLNSFYK